MKTQRENVSSIVVVFTFVFVFYFREIQLILYFKPNKMEAFKTKRFSFFGTFTVFICDFYTDSDLFKYLLLGLVFEVFENSFKALSSSRLVIK
jgi:hypothetical protein